MNNYNLGNLIENRKAFIKICRWCIIANSANPLK